MIRAPKPSNASMQLRASAKEWRPDESSTLLRASKPLTTSKPLSTSAKEWRPDESSKPLSTSKPLTSSKPLSTSAKEWRPDESSKPLTTSKPLSTSAKEWTPRPIPSTDSTSEIVKMFENRVRIMDNEVVAIDCEMVGVGPEGKGNALAHVAIVDFDGKQIYNMYVIPRGGIHSITNYRTKHSGITRNLLSNPRMRAKPFEEVKSEVHVILKDKIIVGHGLINDFKVLEYIPDDGSVWDTTLIDEYMKNHPDNIDLPEDSKRRQAKKLKVLAKEIANNNIQKNVRNASGKPKGHSPLEDARASMNLYRISQGFPKIVYHNMAVA